MFSNSNEFLSIPVRFSRAVVRQTTGASKRNRSNVTNDAREIANRFDRRRATAKPSRTAARGAAPGERHSMAIDNDVDFASRARACVTQVEWYFSDTNVVTDAWLRAHIARDVHGWVSLAVLSEDCPKLAKLVRRAIAVEEFASKTEESISANDDEGSLMKTSREGEGGRMSGERDAGAWRRVLPEALRRASSAIVEVSEDGERVRRIAPMPEIDVEDVQRRTVAVENFKSTNADWRVDDVKAAFASAGEVVNVRIRYPGQGKVEVEKPLGLDLVATSSAKTHALVEFASEPEARLAVEMLDNSNDWRNGMRVKLLVKPGAAKKKKNTQHKAKEAAVGDGAAENSMNSENSVDAEKIDSAVTPKRERREKKDYSKWASAGAFKENRAAVAVIVDDVDKLKVEDGLERKLVVEKVRQPTMPAQDGSPGFTRSRTARAELSEV